MSERCDRCGSVGEDRRTLWMACFYAMDELGLPFRREVLFDANVDELELAKDPFVAHLPGGESITLTPGTVRSKGELTPKNLFTLRVCKRCRGEWMQSIKGWFHDTPGGQDHDADEPGDGIGSGIYVRTNGSIREVTEEEFAAMHGGPR